MARGEVMRSGSGRVVSLARRTDGLRVNGASRCGLRFRRRYPRTLTREARTEMRDEPLFAGTSNRGRQRRARRSSASPLHAGLDAIGDDGRGTLVRIDVGLRLDGRGGGRLAQAGARDRSARCQIEESHPRERGEDAAWRGECENCDEKEQEPAKLQEGEYVRVNEEQERRGNGNSDAEYDEDRRA